MKTMLSSAVILYPSEDSEITDMYKRIEQAGRTCYKSKSKKVEELKTAIQIIEDDPDPFALILQLDELKKELIEAERESANNFIRKLIKSGHEAMIEHGSMTVRFVVDRGVSHEIVRHRIASYAQESTRYCNYSQDKFGNEISVISPCFFMGEENIAKLNEWTSAMNDAERHYFKLLELGAKPEEARCVLPTSLKTELIVTMNLRSWRHFFKLRAAGETGKPHPQMSEVAVRLLKKCQEIMPELFDDIEVPHE